MDFGLGPQIPQAGWNLSQHLIMEISNYLQNAGSNYVACNYGKTFDYLKAVKHRVMQSFNEEERGKLRKKEGEIMESLSYWQSPTLKMNNPKLWSKINDKIYEKIEEYTELLMDLLKKYGFLIPEKADIKRMF